jgi:hypothetical protein
LLVSSLRLTPLFISPAHRFSLPELLSGYIFHTVLLERKPETTAEEVEAAMAFVRALPQKIEGITNVVAGANLHTSPKNHGYTHGFILVFDTEEHFRAYAPHPDHQPVSQALRRISQTIVDFDLQE